jgi:CubicO group peptidase (beta-lactamase class C family)
MEFKKLLILLLLCFIHVSLVAKEPLDLHTIQQIDAVFKEYNQPNSAGCALGIYNEGTMMYAQGYGYANLENQIPITPNTIFDIASISKQFTAASILLLEQQNKLSLNDDVRKYIPELPVYKNTITLRNLLNHTSGLRDYISLLEIKGVQYDDVAVKEDALAIIIRQKETEFPTGEGFRYTNSGYFLASIIVERITGLTLRQYVDNQIFQKLGMINTAFIDDHNEVINWRAIGYSQIGNNLKESSPNWEIMGPGGVLTNINDMLLWNKNFFSHLVGKQDLIDGLTTDSTLNSGQPLGYGLGLWIREFNGQKTYEHTGVWGGYRSGVFYLPSESVSIAIFCNIDTETIFEKADRLKNILLVNTKESPVNKTDKVVYVELEENGFSPYEGIFEHPTFGSLYFFNERNEYFFMNKLIGKEQIFPLTDHSFLIPHQGIEINFEKSPNNTVLKASWKWPSGELIPLVKKANMILGEKQLLDLEGVYYSDEIGTSLDVSIRNGRIYARFPKKAEILFTSMGNGQFLGNKKPLVSLEIEGNNAQTNTIVVSAFGLRNLKFYKEKSSDR